MNWFAQSLDLNLIENLWRIIKIRINAGRHQIHNIEIMKQAIKKKWELLKEKNYMRCIKSMPRRIQLIIKAKEKIIKYWFFHLILYSLFHQILELQSIKLNVAYGRRIFIEGIRGKMEVARALYDHFFTPIVHKFREW